MNNCPPLTDQKGNADRDPRGCFVVNSNCVFISPLKLGVKYVMDSLSHRLFNIVNMTLLYQFGNYQVILNTCYSV